MKKYIFTFLFLSIASVCYAQGFPVKLPNFKGQTLSLIKKSKDWNILTSVSGDLNYDHKKDFALVLESKDSMYEQREPFRNERVKGKARILLVFLQKNGKQIVHTQNNKFIARYYEAGDNEYLEPNLSIEKNKLGILQIYIRSSRSYTFQLKSNTFLITNAYDSNINEDTNTFVNQEYDFINHKLIVTTGRVCFEEEKVTPFEFLVKPKALSDFNEMYSWEVMPDHFL